MRVFGSARGRRTAASAPKPPRLAGKVWKTTHNRRTAVAQAGAAIHCAAGMRQPETTIRAKGLDRITTLRHAGPGGTTGFAPAWRISAKNGFFGKDRAPAKKFEA
jgi:hypothetical protein